MADYFKEFCDALNCEECRREAKRVEKGTLNKEKFYEFVIEKHGEEKVRLAHERAISVVSAERNKPKESKEKRTTTKKITVVPSAKEEKKEESCPTCGQVTEEEIKEVKKRGILGAKAKTEFKEICRGCVAVMIDGLLTVMGSWYTGDNRKKIEELSRKVERGEINLEDGLMEVLVMDGGWDAVNRVLKDFNMVMEKALEKAVMKRPELRQAFNKGGEKS